MSDLELEAIATKEDIDALRSDLGIALDLLAQGIKNEVDSLQYGLRYDIENSVRNSLAGVTFEVDVMDTDILKAVQDIRTSIDYQFHGLDAVIGNEIREAFSHTQIQVDSADTEILRDLSSKYDALLYNLNQAVWEIREAPRNYSQIVKNELDYIQNVWYEWYRTGTDKLKNLYNDVEAKVWGSIYDGINTIEERMIGLGDLAAKGIKDSLGSLEGMLKEAENNQAGMLSALLELIPRLTWEYFEKWLTEKVPAE